MATFWTKWRNWLVDHVRALVKLHDTPHSIAGGVGIGVLFGFIPLFPIKTLLAILFAWMFRCSRVAAAIAVTLHDVTLPIWPVILRYEYKIGFWLLSNPHRLPPNIGIKHLKLAQWMNWSNVARIGGPLLLGSVIIGLPIAVVSFFISLEVVKKYQARRRHAVDGGERKITSGD
jgi:uncharacterized protein (DUF2062 family)